MAVVRTLSVSLTAKTTKFNRGMKKAQTRLGRFKKAVFSLKGALLGLGALGIIRGFTKTADEIDRIAKLSERLGVSTEKLIALGHAAKITGASTEDVAKGMERFAQSIGEARQGLSTPLRALETLGIEADSFLKKDLDTQLLEVADAMKAMDDQQNRIAASAQLFGRGGKKLINLLQGGSESIHAFTREAKELGILFSADEAKEVTEMNDAWARIGKVFEGIARTVVIDLAPSLIDLSVVMLELINLGTRVKVGYAQLSNVFAFLGSGRGGRPAMSVKQLEKNILALEKTQLASIQRIELLKRRIAERAKKLSPPTPDIFQPDIEGGRVRVRKQFPAGPDAAVVTEAFKTIDETDDRLRRTADAADAMGDAFGGAFQSAILGGNNLRGVLQGLLQDIASIGLRKAVTEPLGEGFGNFIKGLNLFGGTPGPGGRPDEVVNAGLLTSTGNQNAMITLGKVSSDLNGF